MTAPDRIVVAAAVVRRGDAFFVTRRHAGVHLEGYWEFPGGKCEAGETLEACLEREILEELAARVRVGDEIFRVSHAYPERIVELRFIRCDLLEEPRAVLVQEMRWVPKAELSSLAFPPADAELLVMLSGQA